MKYRALIVVLIGIIALSSLPGIVEAADYIEPTFTPNTNGPTIGTTVKSVIEVDGKYYRDSNGNGELDDFENWELSVDKRVEDLVSRMTIDEKLGLLVIEYRRDLGIYSDNTSLDGLLDEKSGESTSIFDTSASYGTTQAITEIGLRRWVLRSNPKPSEIAKWNNALQQVAEGTSNGVPAVIVSNSRNENGEVTFGMNDIGTRRSSYGRHQGRRRCTADYGLC